MPFPGKGSIPTQRWRKNMNFATLLTRYWEDQKDSNGDANFLKVSSGAWYTVHVPPSIDCFNHELKASKTSRQMAPLQDNICKLPTTRSKGQKISIEGSGEFIQCLRFAAKSSSRSML